VREDLPDHEEWSAAQTETTVTVDGHELSMAYRDGAAVDADDPTTEGTPAGEDAAPVVFLHGIPTWSYLWGRVVPALETDVRTIAPDLVGYGNSARHDGFDRSIRAQEQAVVGLLDELGLESATLVAHDIGGGVALRVAANHPDRVDRLVLSNAVCYDSWPVEFISDLGLPNTASTDRDELDETLDGAFAGGTVDEADPAFVAGMKAPWLAEGGPRALARAAVATNTNHTMELDYDAVSADVLCLWGADDVMQPLSCGERLADDTDGRVVELDEAYHWVVEDRPDAYRDELERFLAE
jgi:pimeloyl-ACP methyl ester carboxylesterase